MIWAATNFRSKKQIIYLICTKMSRHFPTESVNYGDIFTQV